jgi:branched-chain amino acid transport system ATP-binding protein
MSEGVDVALSVRGLSKSFGALHVAQSIALDLKRGARLGLIGPNGAGKTSFVNLLTGILSADAGEIVLGGRDITRLKPETRVRLGLVRTHQINTLLAESSPRENVAIAVAERERIAWRSMIYSRRWRQCLAEADEQLAALGIRDLADRTVKELPYGQQRLLEIAIALVLKPRVLLLDEPAVGLSPDRVTQLDALLRRIRDDRGVTIIMIEHVIRLVVDVCDRITVMSSGRPIAEGTADEVTRNTEVIEAYLGSALNAVDRRA